MMKPLKFAAAITAALVAMSLTATTASAAGSIQSAAAVDSCASVRLTAALHPFSNADDSASRVTFQSTGWPLLEGEYEAHLVAELVDSAGNAIPFRDLDTFEAAAFQGAPVGSISIQGTQFTVAKLTHGARYTFSLRNVYGNPREDAGCKATASLTFTVPPDATPPTPGDENPSRDPKPAAGAMVLSDLDCVPGTWFVRDESSPDDEPGSSNGLPPFFRLSDVTGHFNMARPTIKVSGFGAGQAAALTVTAASSGNQSIDWVLIRLGIASSDAYNVRTQRFDRLVEPPVSIEADAKGIITIAKLPVPAGPLRGDELRRLLTASLTYKNSAGLTKHYKIPLETLVKDKSCGGSAADDSVPGKRGAPVQVDILKNDAFTDLPDEKATVEVTGVPAGVAVHLNADRTITVTVSPSFEAKRATFGYTLTDQAGTYDAKVTVSLDPKPALMTPATKPKPHTPTVAPPVKPRDLPPTGVADHLGAFAGLGGLLVLAGGSLLAYRRRLGGTDE